MTTTKQQIADAKSHLREPLREVLLAEQVLLDSKIAAAPRIAALIKAAGGVPGPHKVRTAPDTVALYSFRKEGEYLADAAGAPVEPGTHGAKAHPIYAIKSVDMSDESE